ncbi:MAG TPA: type II secretion system protein [Bacillota bacterium]|nr:type II secretion system protein [Bacillota bacterium]
MDVNRIIKKRWAAKFGFTLTELLVVIAVLGILTAIAVPTYYGVTESSNRKLFETNHNIIVSGINMYISAHNGAYPTDLEDLVRGDYILAEEDEYDVEGNKISFFKDQPKGASYELELTNDGLELVSTYKSQVKRYKRSS